MAGATMDLYRAALLLEGVKTDVNAVGLFQVWAAGDEVCWVIDIDDNDDGEGVFEGPGFVLYDNSPFAVSEADSWRHRAKTLMDFGVGLEAILDIVSKVSGGWIVKGRSKVRRESRALDVVDG